MKKQTIYDTFIITHILPKPCYFILKIFGWKFKGEKPNFNKFIIIVAPHTSNWDAVMGFFQIIVIGVKPFILVKDNIFVWPFKNFLLWLGLIPVDRTKPHNIVSQVVDEFNKRDNFSIIVLPSGTRKKVSNWKTGFYYIAQGANIPIILGFIDYKKKEYGFLKTFYPTGNIDEDIKTIKSSYQGIVGKNPENQSV